MSERVETARDRMEEEREEDEGERLRLRLKSASGSSRVRVLVGSTLAIGRILRDRGNARIWERCCSGLLLLLLPRDRH